MEQCQLFSDHSVYWPILVNQFQKCSVNRNWRRRGMENGRRLKMETKNESSKQDSDEVFDRTGAKVREKRRRTKQFVCMWWWEKTTRDIGGHVTEIWWWSMVSCWWYCWLSSQMGSLDLNSTFVVLSRSLWVVGLFREGNLFVAWKSPVEVLENMYNADDHESWLK